MQVGTRIPTGRYFPEQKAPGTPRRLRSAGAFVHQAHIRLAVRPCRLRIDAFPASEAASRSSGRSCGTSWPCSLHRNFMLFVPARHTGAGAKRRVKAGAGKRKRGFSDASRGPPTRIRPQIRPQIHRIRPVRRHPLPLSELSRPQLLPLLSRVICSALAPFPALFSLSCVSLPGRPRSFRSPRPIYGREARGESGSAR